MVRRAVLIRQGHKVDVLSGVESLVYVGIFGRIEQPTFCVDGKVFCTSKWLYGDGLHGIILEVCATNRTIDTYVFRAFEWRVELATNCPFVVSRFLSQVDREQGTEFWTNILVL